MEPEKYPYGLFSTIPSELQRETAMYYPYEEVEQRFPRISVDRYYLLQRASYNTGIPQEVLRDAPIELLKKYAMEKYSQNDALYNAAMNGHLNVVQYLI